MQRFGMFTKAGNAMIQGVVLTAKAANMDWDQVLELLADIGTMDGFEEATDTAVREMVFQTLQNG